jgi:hypothetical protein
MSVSIPRDRCYYYECSSGTVRLTYFIPTDELRKLVRAGKISTNVENDYPDGVDLDCTEPDFAEFNEQYGYRPVHSAEELQNAFYAIFSSTSNWNTYRGSGLIHADDLESKIPQVNKKLRETIPEEKMRQPPTTFRERYRKRIETARLKLQVENQLKKLQVHGIDKRKPIDKQSFTKIRMSKGRKAHEVFSILQHKQKHKKSEGG